MAVSEAKLEANRRNAMRSCGPRTEAGKQSLQAQCRQARHEGRDARALGRRRTRRSRIGERTGRPA